MEKKLRKAECLAIEASNNLQELVKLRDKMSSCLSRYQCLAVVFSVSTNINSKVIPIVLPSLKNL